MGHPYGANARIKEVAGEASVLVIDDNFDDLLWGEDGSAPSRDKPYRAWCKIRELCESAKNLDHAPQLKDVVRFAFDW